MGRLLWLLGVKVVESRFTEVVVNIGDVSAAFRYSGPGLEFFMRGILIILESREVVSKVRSV